MISGVKHIYKAPFYTFLKKHYCPVCGTQLCQIEVSKIVNSKSPEAKQYDFSGGDGFMVGNIKFIWVEFYCETCDKRISIGEMQRIEKEEKKKRRQKR